MWILYWIFEYNLISQNFYTTPSCIYVILDKNVLETYEFLDVRFIQRMLYLLTVHFQRTDCCDSMTYRVTLLRNTYCTVADSREQSSLVQYSTVYSTGSMYSTVQYSTQYSSSKLQVLVLKKEGL